MAGRAPRRTSLTLVGCAGMLLGIGFTNVLATPGPVVLCLLSPIFWQLRRRALPAFVLIAAVGLVLGSWRGGAYVRQADIYAQAYGQPATVTVTAQDDAVYGSHSQLSFTGGNVVLNGQRAAGKIQVSGFGLPAVFQGDKIALSGKLMPSQGAYQGRISYGKLSLLGHHATWVGSVRRRFNAGMTSALPEPHASFALGLLIGQRSTLPDEVKQDLLMVGLTHIVAVSGYNLTIMLHASQRLFGRRSKRITTGLSLLLIGGFLMLAGASASIVRAAIVSTLSIFAGYYGRSFRPFNLIILAAAVTAWMNPFYVWDDASWYLSFLAFYGILVIAPLIQEKMPERWRHALIPAVALESISAETMTLPYVLHTFGQMSLVGLPANILVVTLVPLAMLLGTVAGVAGMILPPLAGWVAWPAKLILTYMLDLAHLIAGLPHVFLENLALSMSQMLGLYAVVTLTALLLSQKTKGSFYAKITDKESLRLTRSKD